MNVSRLNRPIAVLAALGLALLAATADAKPAGKWRIAFDHKADNDGSIVLRVAPLDGTPIEGRKKHSATRSVAEVFGLDPKRPPTAEAIHNVLAGRRADGETPRTGSGKPLPAAIVEGARKRFKAALGVPTRREPTAE